MRKLFTGLALLGVLIGSSACGSSGSTGSSSSPVVNHVSTASAATCSAKFSEYAELAEESAEIIGGMGTSRASLKAVLELTDAAVETGRFLIRTCDSVPAGFVSSVDDLAEGADDLRNSLY